MVAFLESKGEDIAVLLEGTSLPEEFLQDPSYWLQAEAMEKFLESALTLHFDSNPKALIEVAHSIPKHRSWGVFDSVLRMMPLSDVFAQPSRFISYFISPEVEITKVERSEQRLSFQVPLDFTQTPLTHLFLRSAFEALPLFSGQPLGLCHWSGELLTIGWGDSTGTQAPEPTTLPALSPETLRSIVSQLERHQMELQQKNADLEARNQQLREAFQKLQSEMRNQPPSDQQLLLDQAESLFLKKNLARLGDYMVRAQQLITILTTGPKSQPTIVKEALRRTDWSWVKENYPLTVMSCFEVLQKSNPKNPARESTPLWTENHSQEGAPHV